MGSAFWHSSKKQQSMQSNDGQTEIERNNTLGLRIPESTSHHIRGRLRGSLPRKQNRAENINSLVNGDENNRRIDQTPLNKTEDQLEKKEAETKENTFREKVGNNVFKLTRLDIPQKIKFPTRSQTGRQRGSNPQKSDKELRLSLENDERKDSYRERSKSRGRQGTFLKNNRNSASSKLTEVQSEENQILEITEAPKTMKSSASPILIPDIQENVSTQEREDDVILEITEAPKTMKS